MTQYRQNVAVANFPIGNFINTSTGAEVTSGTVSGYALVDGSAVALTGSASYVGNQWIWSSIQAAAMDGLQIGLTFNLSGCLPIHYALATDNTVNGAWWPSDSSVMVQPALSPTARAANLRAAVTAAAAMTPGGNSLSATNRATVLIPPGLYDFGTGNPHGLVLATEFVDLIGLGQSPRDTILTSAIATAGYGTLEHSSSNNRLENFTMALTSVTSTGSGYWLSNTQPAAYFPSGDSVWTASITITGTVTPGTTSLSFAFNQGDIAAGDNVTFITVPVTIGMTPAQFVAALNAKYAATCYGVHTLPVAATTATSWTSPVVFTLTYTALAGQVTCSASPSGPTFGVSYTPSTAPVGQQSTVMRNVRMIGGGKQIWNLNKSGHSASETLSMRFGVGYAGYYERCYAECGAFGWVANVYGTFVDCIAGDYSFGHGGTTGGGSSGQATITVGAGGAISGITALNNGGTSYAPASASFVVSLTGNTGSGGLAVVTTNSSGVITGIAAIPYAAGTGYSAGTVTLSGGGYVGEFAGVAIRCRATNASFGGGQSGSYAIDSVMSGYCEECYDSPYLNDDTGGFYPALSNMSGDGMGGGGAIIAQGGVVLNCKSASCSSSPTWYGTIVNHTFFAGNYAANAMQNKLGVSDPIYLYGATVVGGTFLDSMENGTTALDSIFQLMDSHSTIVDCDLVTSNTYGIGINDNGSAVTVAAAGNRYTNLSVSSTGLGSNTTSTASMGPAVTQVLATVPLGANAPAGWVNAAAVTGNPNVNVNQWNGGSLPAFPTRFSSLAIDSSGYVTFNNTGIAANNLPTLPTNFASLAITTGGAVTVGTNSDKTGYSLLGSSPVATNGPNTATLEKQITQWDDYLRATGNALQWNNPSGTWAGGNLAGATIIFTACTEEGREIVQLPGYATTPTGTQLIEVDLPSADSGRFAVAGKLYRYQVLIVKSGYRSTSIGGAIDVAECLDPPSS
jgi:hypothetical protein